MRKSLPRPGIGIAGTGRVAQSLGRLLRDVGQPVLAVAGRDWQRTETAAQFIGVDAVSFSELPNHADRVIIAVSDDAIPLVARALADAGFRGMALHTCGSLGTDAIGDLSGSCGVLHPIQSIPSPQEGLTLLRGITFSLTGEGEARAWAEEIVHLLDGKVLGVPERARPAFHAATVMASNYVTALLDASTALLRSAGIEEREGLEALATISAASVRNAALLGPAPALTGPVRRGDCETIRRHMQVLTGAPETVRDLYIAGGLHTLGIARRLGLPENRAVELERILKEICG